MRFNLLHAPKRLKHLLSLLVILIAYTPHSLAQINVVVSITPIHSLTSAVMEGVATPDLLIKGLSSPHTFNIRPSTAKTLAQAHIVIWVSENLETTFKEKLQILAPQAQHLKLSDAPQLQRLAQRRSLLLTTHQEHNHNHNTSDHDHAPVNIDPHIWLSTTNAKIITQIIAQALAQLDPKNASTFLQNSATYRIKLEKLNQELNKIRTKISKASFITLHDTYQYLAKEYDLAHAGTISLNPSITPSAQHLQFIRDLITKERIPCVISEPQFSNKLIQGLSRELNINTIQIDPLGTTIPYGPDHYPQTMTSIMEKILRCTSP